jgi:hypothetical protein
LIFRKRSTTLRDANADPEEFAMPSPMTAPQILNREFLEVRAKILELAASLDRLDRSEGSATGDPRFRRVREGIEIPSPIVPTAPSACRSSFPATTTKPGAKSSACDPTPDALSSSGTSAGRG